MLLGVSTCLCAEGSALVFHTFMLLSVKSTDQNRARPPNSECTSDGVPCSFRHSDVTAACGSAGTSNYA